MNTHKLNIINDLYARLKAEIAEKRLSIEVDRRLGDVDYLEAVELLFSDGSGEGAVDDIATLENPVEAIISVTYAACAPAKIKRDIEDALFWTVKSSPLNLADMYTGSGDGTLEYAAVFNL